MIITRTPLRISFVGGGSDVPWFYSEEPGACVAASINKYVYVTVNAKYDGRIRVAYSHTENVQKLNEVRHDLAREALRLLRIDRGIEIHSIADVPGGTGLGSSSAFTVGLMNGLHCWRDTPKPRSWIAAEACSIELGACRKAIGKQDQYMAAYGGIQSLSFTEERGVRIDPIPCDLSALSEHCLLLDTEIVRPGDAGAVLASQRQDRDDVRRLASMARDFARELTRDNLELCGAIMHDAWSIKRTFVEDVYGRMYDVAHQAGAWGGKLCGAGGGGFLLFLAPPDRHEKIAQILNLRHVPVQLGVPGSTVIYRD